MIDKDTSEYVVGIDDSIETALAAIEANAHKCVIVLDDAQRVVGTLSDGDIRKALLNHRLLSTPVEEVMNMDFIWVSPEDVEKATELFQRYHYIVVIPVIGPSNELLDVLTAY